MSFILLRLIVIFRLEIIQQKQLTTIITMLKQKYLINKTILSRTLILKLLWSSFLIFSFINASFADSFKVTFSKKGGKYSQAIQLTLLNNSGGKIFYTIDGTSPSTSSTLYKKPLSIDKTTVVRAMIEYGGQSGRVYTETYLINENTNFPIVSIAIKPNVLFDKTTGWFYPGPNAEENHPFKGANFWTKKEEKVNVEIFESDGVQVFNSEVGLRLFGGMSRGFPQKSLAIACRKDYGASCIAHQIFPDKKQDCFKHIVLRNSGSDWGKTHARDAIITGLLDDVDVSKQAYRPALVFINGAYWGIYNIREKINRHYLAYEFGVDKDKIDLIEHKRNIKVGGIKHYEALKKFIESNDLAIPDNYEYVKTQMDVDNFMIYQIVQIYIDNMDGGGNIKFWRPQTEDGRWRWVLYDTDWGFGLHSSKAYKNNTLELQTDANGPNWPNPPWSTFLLRNLLKNEDFRNAFVLKYSDFINTVFQPDNVIRQIDDKQKRLEPEIQRHIKRWDLSHKYWLKQMDIMREFARKRPAYMRDFLSDMFDVGDLATVKIEASEGGKINLNNNIDIDGQQFEGKYFNHQPITIHAIPNRGYMFSHWKVKGKVIKNPSLKLTLKQSLNQVTAIFEPSSAKGNNMVVINEIAVKNTGAGDWLELYNGTEEVIDLTGWILADSSHEYVIPYGKIQPQSYAVLCAQKTLFEKSFPNVKNVIGNLSFRFNKSEESLKLYAPNNALVDRLFYKIDKSSSLFTLCLKDPALDNSTLQHWEITIGKGTPCETNPTYAEILKAERAKNQRRMTLVGIVIILLLFVGYRFLRK